MNAPSEHAQHFLTELHNAVKGDLNAKVSMYEIGRILDMDKERAGRVGEEIISLGWAEIKTLSGAIGITAEGLLAADPNGGKGGAQTLTLGRERVLAAEGRADVEKALSLIQERIPELSVVYADIEEMVIDLKTAQLQMLSPKPKTVVVREILRSLQAALNKAGAKDTASVIERMIA